MSSSNKLSTLHRYGLFEKNTYDKLAINKSHIIIPFSKFSRTKYKRILNSTSGYIFYIFSPVSNTECVVNYSLNDILQLLYNNKELFVDFIHQMNIYFNEKQIIHNNYFSTDEINDILIRIYINEIVNSENTSTIIPPTVELLLDMVESAVVIENKKQKQHNNPFQDFIFCETPSPPIQTKNITHSVPPSVSNPVLIPIHDTIKPIISPIVSRPNNHVKNEKEKYKKKSIPLVLKRRVWDKYFGEKNGVAQCPCCKLSQISTFSFHCGHIISEKNGGMLVLDNLIPLCQSCNSSMGIRSYTEFCNDIGIPSHIIL